jgi:hypothetical protein
LGKAIALRTDLPQIAVPTTYAGSEATPILGETENGLKTTQRSMKVLPEVIIYDVALTLTLPLSISVTSLHQCDCPCRRGTVCQGQKSHHFTAGGAGHCSAGSVVTAHR